MSDERDPSTLPRWEELLRRLDETHRRLETAHADYLEAAAQSQRALTQVIDSFGTISETIRELVPSPDGPPAPRESIKPTEKESGEQTKEAAPVSKPPPDPDHGPPAPATSPRGDQDQNELPMRLHSRGIAIPEQPKRVTLSEEVSDVPAKLEPTKAGSSLQRELQIDQPSLVETARSDGQTPFSGLEKESRIVLSNDGFGVAPALNEILTHHGYRVRVDSRRPELSAPADTVIFLGGLRAPSNLDDAMAVIEDAIFTAERMTTRLMQPGSGFLAAVDTAGGFGLDAFDPVSAPFGALLGLIRLLDRRHPGARTKLIDIDGGKMPAPKIAEILADELIKGGDHSPIALGLEQRRGVKWIPFNNRSRPARWLEDETPPLVYMPGPDAVFATAVERLAIAHELPVALLRRRHTPSRLAHKFSELGIETRTTDYDLNRLFSVMDFLDRIRDEYGPIAAIVAESFPAQTPDELVSWEAMRPPLDEFNALLAMTINDPLRLLGVGIGPKTPPVVASALRYFARAESLRRNDHLQIRLAHLQQNPSRRGNDINPCDFALTEFLSGADPLIAEARFGRSK